MGVDDGFLLGNSLYSFVIPFERSTMPRGSGSSFSVLNNSRLSSVSIAFSWLLGIGGAPGKLKDRRNSLRAI